MDIKLSEIREHKTMMETEIFLALVKFNQKTGLSVEEITISTVQRVSPTCQKIAVSVSCKIEIT